MNLILGAQVRDDPEAARDQILAAFSTRVSGASVPEVALALRVHRVTLWRWVVLLGLVPDIEAIQSRALKEGWRRAKLRNKKGP